jgi:lysophospholipase L1-like esterase
MSIVLAGDSLAVGLAAPLQRICRRLLCVAQDGRRARDAQHIPAGASLVIISLGTNDADARAAEGWERGYAERLDAIMREADAARFVWLLPPAMGEPGREFFVEQRRAVIRSAASRAAAAIFDPWPSPVYQDFWNGRQIREEDGIHYTAAGYALWADAIAQALGDALP